MPRFEIPYTVMPLLLFSQFPHQVKLTLTPSKLVALQCFYVE